MDHALEQHTAALLHTLRDVLCEVADPSEVLARILRHAVETTGADRGVLVERGDPGKLEHKVLHGFAAAHFDGPSGEFSRDLCARVLESGQDVLLRSAMDDEFFRRSGSLQAIGRSAVLCMHVRARDRVAAVVQLEKRELGGFNEGHRTHLRQLFDSLAGPMFEALQASREILESRERLAKSEDRLRQESESQRALLQQESTFGRFIGRSPAVRELEPRLRAVAARSSPVLLTGETGTGKTILAQALHYAGPRAKKPFITVFCPMLERSRVESDLFGHRRGAFTGAERDREGKVQAAEGGTLFLDEIGELSPEIQAKLLRLLDERRYEVMGDPRERTADIRIIAATNRDLAVEVKNGRFREDLLARLDMAQVRVPPLRERREDIGLILRDCLDREDGGRWIEMSQEAIDYLEKQPLRWAHNVRDLMKLAARLAEDPPKAPVTVAMVARFVDHGTDGPAPDGDLATQRDADERDRLRRALEQYPHLTRKQLAQQLGISASTLQEKLRRHGLKSRP